MSIFKDKVLLITGGTGSFGNAVLRRFLDSDIKEIRIFSRDEKKQDDMRHALQNPKVKFYIGNVRDKQSVDVAMRGVGSYSCGPELPEEHEIPRKGKNTFKFKFFLLFIFSFDKIIMRMLGGESNGKY
jgi:shikimate 5-dehydrogenase